MKPSLTIHAPMTAELFYTIVQNGMDADDLAQQIGLDIKIFDEPDARIPLDQHILLWKAAAKFFVDRPDFALTLGAQNTPETMGVLGNIFLNSRTLREAVQHACRYSILAAESDHYELEETGDKAIFYFHIQYPEYYTHYAVERSLALALTWTKTFLKKVVYPIEVLFRHPTPDYLETYKKVFNAPIHFEQKVDALVFPRAHLDLKGAQHNPYLQTILNRQADSILPTLQKHQDIRSQVQQLIIEHLPSGKVDIEMIATELNMTRKTLYRRLKEEGTSFQELLSQNRQTLAMEYLKKTAISINEIAFLLGFSESSAFHRYFKRNAGVSPKQYRQSFLSLV